MTLGDERELWSVKVMHGDHASHLLTEIVNRLLCPMNVGLETLRLDAVVDGRDVINSPTVKRL